MAHKGETENGTHYSEPPYRQFAAKGGPSGQRVTGKASEGGRTADNFLRMIASGLGIPGILPQTTGPALAAQAPDYISPGILPQERIAPAADAIEGPGIPDAILANQAKYAPTSQGPTTPSTPTPTTPTPTPLESGMDYGVVSGGGGSDLPSYAGVGLGKTKPPATGIQTEIPAAPAAEPSIIDIMAGKGGLTGGRTGTAIPDTTTAEGPGLGQRAMDWLQSLGPAEEQPATPSPISDADFPKGEFSAGELASNALRDIPSLDQEMIETGAFGDKPGRFSPADVLGTEVSRPPTTPPAAEDASVSTATQQANLPPDPSAYPKQDIDTGTPREKRPEILKPGQTSPFSVGGGLNQLGALFMDMLRKGLLGGTGNYDPGTNATVEELMSMIGTGNPSGRIRNEALSSLNQGFPSAPTLNLQDLGAQIYSPKMDRGEQGRFDQ
jgi:hypothetical protein